MSLDCLLEHTKVQQLKEAKFVHVPCLNTIVLPQYGTRPFFGPGEEYIVYVVTASFEVCHTDFGLWDILCRMMSCMMIFWSTSKVK